MSKQTINIGASPNDGTGTPLRTSFDYTNQNFTELYTALGGGVGLPGATTQVIFNDGGTNLAGDAGLVYNKTTDALTVAGLVTAGSATITGDLTVDTNVLKVDSTNNAVGIGTAVAPVYSSKLRVEGGVEIHTSQALNIQPGNTNPYEIVNRSAGGFAFYPTGSSLGLTLAPSGNLSIANGNLVMSTSGKGIDFSAVTGGTGTATGNVLNDYEEGTWTIGLTFGGGNTGLTTALNTGRYTKIGRQVTVCGRLELSNKGSSTGAAAITGLPFSIASGNDSQQAASFRFNGVSYTGSFQGYGGVSSTSINLEQISEAGSPTDITNSNFSNGTSIQISFTYTV